jgi:hypothetical protein
MPSSQALFLIADISAIAAGQQLFQPLTKVSSCLASVFVLQFPLHFLSQKQSQV